MVHERHRWVDWSHYGGSNGSGLRLGPVVVQTQPSQPAKIVETVDWFQRVLVLAPFVCYRLCAPNRAWLFYLSLQGMVPKDGT